MGLIAKSLWFAQPNVAEIRESEVKRIEPEYCIVKSKYSAISRGTERLVFKGDVPEELYDSMKCPYMSGNFDFPIKYGYSVVGKVIEGPDTLIDQLVHVLHPHQDYFRVHSKDVFVLPNNISMKRMVLISNMQTVVNAIWDANINIGDNILIIGFGFLGSLITRLVDQIPGTSVDVLEVNESRKNLVEKMGFSLISNLEKNSYDKSFNCSASQEGLQSAIDAVGLDGKVIEVSWYGSNSVNLNLGGYFHRYRKKIISSQINHMNNRHRSRWTQERFNSLIVDLLRDQDYDNHITSTIKFNELPRKYEKILSEDNGQELIYSIQYE